jgi:hypothetical protein
MLNPAPLALPIRITTSTQTNAAEPINNTFTTPATPPTSPTATRPEGMPPRPGCYKHVDACALKAGGAVASMGGIIMSLGLMSPPNSDNRIEAYIWGSMIVAAGAVIIGHNMYEIKYPDSQTAAAPTGTAVAQRPLRRRIAHVATAPTSPTNSDDCQPDCPV